MSIDNEYSPGEAEYFRSGDASGVIQEQGGRQSVPDQAHGHPQLSDSERRYFETGGDVTEDLRREYSGAPAQQEDRPLSPRVRQLYDSLRVMNGELQDQRLARARAEERTQLLTDVLSPEQPHPQPEYDQPEQQESRYRSFDDDPYGAMKDVVDHAREQEVIGRYQSRLAVASRQDQEFSQAYHYAINSRGLELLSRQYPAHRAMS